MPKEESKKKSSGSSRLDPLKKNVSSSAVETSVSGLSINALSPLPILTVQEGKRHVAKMIGALPGNAGHRVTGPLTNSVYKFTSDKYLRYYANLDGVLRYYYLKAEGTTRKILAKYIEQFLAIVKSGGELTNMSPSKWEDGRARSILVLVNTLNRRRDDVTCPINDLNVARALTTASHPRRNDALLYLKHHDVGGIFYGLYAQFQGLVNLLAKDIREYDTKIVLNAGGFGYQIKKDSYADVKDFILAKSRPDMPVVKLLDQELVYDENLFRTKVLKEQIELVYVENLRVLYMRNPAISCLQFQYNVTGEPIIEKNYHQITYHGYQKIAGGFVATPNGEPESMELIKTNMATLECHMRPKFGRFFLSFKRVDSDFTYQIIITEDSTERTISSMTYIKTRIESATFLGYVSNGHLVITDLLRIEGREVNVDLTRAHFDSEELEPFMTCNISVTNPIDDDRDCYDILLRSEYGVFRARSLVKTRIYDKIGWFYDYIQTIGVSAFDRLYGLKDTPLTPILKFCRNLVLNNLPVTNDHREMNASMEELIVTMDNRFAPPLIVNVLPAPRRAQHSKFAKQSLNGNVFQLNKYYVISRSSSKSFSIDAPPIPFLCGYSDAFFQYQSEEVDLSTTNFARFPGDWNDEIYHDGVIRYDKYVLFEEKARNMKFDVAEGYYNEIQIYQPFHANQEENFLVEFSKLKLEIEPTILMKRRRKSGKKM